MSISWENRLLVLFFIFTLLSACAHDRRIEEVNFYFTPDKISGPRQFSYLRDLVAGINERKKLHKKSPDWLKESYRSLKIKRLNEVPPEEYAGYAKFVNALDPSVYIIIHPAYYAFFMNDSVLSSRSDLEVSPSKNIVERFCSRFFLDPEPRMMQEQEKCIMDFLEVVSAEKRLVILVLPRDYQRQLSYGYLEGHDEYVRFINEVTDMSEAVLYVESLEYNSGYLGEADLTSLSNLINSVGARKIMLGGEFAGRCLNNAYASLLRKFDPKDIYVVPEITAATYKDILATPVSALFTADGMINFGELSRSLKYSDRGEVNIQHLFIYNTNSNKMEPLN
jgi:hypothetical protein